MDFSQLFQTILAFIFVLGLMFLTLWFIKYCQQKGATVKLGKCFNKKSRINIIERQRLDLKNSIILFQCDNTEYLVITGEKNHTLLQQKKTKE